MRSVKNPYFGSLLFTLFLTFCLAQVAEVLYLHRRFVPAAGIVFVAVLAFSHWALSSAARTSLRVHWGIFLVILVIIFPIFSILGLHSFYGFGSSISPDVENFLIWTVVVGSVWAVTGYVIGSNRFDIPPTFSLLALLLWGGGLYLNSESFRVDTWALRQVPGLEDMSHLFFSEIGVILSFSAYASAQGAPRKIFVLSLATFFLFIGGGRSSLFATGLAIFIFEIFTSREMTSVKKVSFVIISIFLVLVGYMAAVSILPDDTLRLIFLLDGLAQDASWSERSRAFSFGVSSLWDGLIFGSAFAYFEEFGDVGLYIHNGLSAWQLYGFPFFAICLFVYGLSVVKMIDAGRHSSISSDYKFKSLYLIYCIVSLMVSKAFAGHFVWFGMALWIAHPVSGVLPRVKST